MITLVAYIACITVLAAVLYLAFAFLADLALRVIARLPAPTQDRLLRTSRQQQRRSR
jgi:hypothetical protein